MVMMPMLSTDREFDVASITLDPKVTVNLMPHQPWLCAQLLSCCQSALLEATYIVSGVDVKFTLQA